VEIGLPKGRCLANALVSSHIVSSDDCCISGAHLYHCLTTFSRSTKIWIPSASCVLLGQQMSFFETENRHKSDCTSLQQFLPSNAEPACAFKAAEIMMRMHCRGAKNPSKASGGTKLQVMYPSICCPSSVNRGVMQIGPLVACGWLDACLYLATSHVLNCTWLPIAPIATPSIGLNPRGG
jgi:hypothetical protein